MLCSSSDGKPEKPTSSGYSLFFKQQLSKRKGKDMSEVGSLWNKLKDEERASYSMVQKNPNTDFILKAT